MGCHPSHGGVQAPIGVLLVLATLGKEGLGGCLQLGSQCHMVRKGLPLLHHRSGVSVDDGYPSQGKLKRGSSFSLLVKWSLASALASSSWLLWSRPASACNVQVYDHLDCYCTNNAAHARTCALAGKHPMLELHVPERSRGPATAGLPT